VHGARKDGKSPNLVRRGFNGGTFDGNPNAFNTRDPWDDRIDPGAPTASPQDYENMVVGAQVDWDLGDVTLTYIPGYFYLDWAADYWLENIPAFLSAHYNQLTNELRLASDNDSRLQWLGGLYAYRVTQRRRLHRRRLSTRAGVPQPARRLCRLRRGDVFGDGSRALDRRRTLQLGPARRRGPDRVRRAVFDADEDYDNVDWKIGVEVDLGAAAMAYATIQTGYQPGTYNLFPATPGQSNLVESATMTAYTTGIKTRFLDDRLQVNDEFSTTTTKTCWCSRST
jgi:iron complex outermembrane recepter protein